MTNAKKIVLASGLKQGWLAARLEIDQPMLSRYINGERKMPKHVARDLAKMLKVSQKSLIG